MNKKNIRVRKGQTPGKLSRDDFRARFFDKFADPAFGAEAKALKRIEVIAWDGYTNYRKAPLTHPAGRGYAHAVRECALAISANRMTGSRRRARSSCAHSKRAWNQRSLQTIHDVVDDQRGTIVPSSGAAEP